MNSRTCRSCGAEMSPEDAFCPECGTHVVDQARIPGDEAAQPGGAPPRRPRQASSAPETDSAYDRPYERLDDMQPSRPAEPPDAPADDDGEPEPIRTFDAPVQAAEDEEYAGYPESPGQRFSPVMLALAAVFVAIIVAGIIVAFAGGSDGGDTSDSRGGLASGQPSAGGFGSMLPDGSPACTKGTATSGTGPRTAIAGAVEVLAAPATWSVRELSKGRFPGTGAGQELTLNPADHDRPVPQSARISVLTVESSVAYFPDQFLIASLPPSNATTVKQDCIDYGPYTALRVQRVELTSGGTLSTRYVALHDKTRRGSAVFFLFEDPRSSKADADFFESMVASAKLLK